MADKRHSTVIRYLPVSIVDRGARLDLLHPFPGLILDTTATLLRRVCRGEKWYAANRSHYYQRMTDLGMSHARVTGMELVSVALSCLAALLYLRSGVQGRVLVIFGVLVRLYRCGDVGIEENSAICLCVNDYWSRVGAW